MQKVLSVIAVSIVSSNNILIGTNINTSISHFAEKGIFINLTVSTTDTLRNEHCRK